ncbi:hypothetical protein VSF3289_04672 [Vibrio scophthalmi]|uniref:Uncharacterized protein n=1 Tax=Vibrio scophthalmi TaxID=45658 RepID=A0A1E3WIA3_9VIBR|nr:hypothetical protein VSF3289_04672 [Vibrio scophthalmi]
MNYYITPTLAKMLFKEEVFVQEESLKYEGEYIVVSFNNNA